MVRRMRAKKMMHAMMTPCLRRVASAPCSSIGCNGRNARRGSLMIGRPLRDGQESWWGVGAIQLRCYCVPQHEVPASYNSERAGRPLHYAFVYLINPLPVFRRSIYYYSTKKHKKSHTNSKSDDDGPIFGPTLSIFQRQKILLIDEKNPRDRAVCFLSFFSSPLVQFPFPSLWYCGGGGSWSTWTCMIS